MTTEDPFPISESENVVNLPVTARTIRSVGMLIIYRSLQINIYVVPIVYLYDAVVSANAHSLQTGMSS